MKPIDIPEICQTIGAKLRYGAGAEPVRSVVIDSRQVEPGSLFIALKGERTDGHEYLEQALEQGAAAVLAQSDALADRVLSCPGDRAVMETENTELALERLAQVYRDQFNLPVVGVTGSVGKTSCKDLIAAALSGRLRVLKTQGNYNNNVGLPLTVFGIEEGTQAAVLEMGMDHFGEISRLSRIARPRIGVITNIGISHIENLGSREGILRAKLEILDYMEPGGLLLLNGDDAMLYGLKDGLTALYYGYEAHNDARILTAEITAEGRLCVEAIYRGEDYRFVLNTPGRHMAYNAMPAIMTAVFLGLSKQEIVRGLESFVPTQMRLNVVNTPRYTILDDSYNASPVSMKAALDTLAALPGNGRRVAILGDMYELGDYAVLGHREVGNHAASLKNLDAVLCAGSNASYIYQEAAENPELRCHYFETLEDLKKKLFDILQKGDIILVKASRGMAFDEICRMILSDIYSS